MFKCGFLYKDVEKFRVSKMFDIFRFVLISRNKGIWYYYFKEDRYFKYIKFYISM